MTRLPETPNPNHISVSRALSLLFDAPVDMRARDDLAAAIRGGCFPWGRFLADGAAPYFFDRIKKSGLEAETPTEIRARLEQLLIEQTGRNIIMLRELDAATAALNSRGVEPVLLKGAALLKTVYPHPGHRRLADLDLLIRKNEMPAAAEALAGIGYSPAGARGHHLNFAARREFPVLIELHTHLFNPDNPMFRYAFPIDAEKFADNAVPFEWEGMRARMPRSEDMALHLICHAVRERYGSLKYFADLNELFEGGLVDRELLYRMCVDYKIQCMFIDFLNEFEYLKKYDIIGGSGPGGRKAGRRRIWVDKPQLGGGLRGRIDEALFYIGKIEGWNRRAAAILSLPCYVFRRGIAKQN